MKKGLTITKGGNRFLNGQPFIASETKTGPDNELVPVEALVKPIDGTILRTCRNCFYRGEMGSMYPSGKGDCHIACKENDCNPVKKLFNVGNVVMPIKINGQPVGNYCPFWTVFWAE